MKHTPPATKDCFNYEYCVEVTKPNDQQASKILRELQLLASSSVRLSYDTQGGNLGTFIKLGEAPDDGGFQHICEAVWRAAGCYLPVQASVVYVEYQPCGSFESQPEDKKT